MFIAGISEFFLLAALILSLRYSPNKTLTIVFNGYIFAVSIIGLTALLGALRYLELADTLYWHQKFVFLSKHIGMPLFIIASLWPNLQTKNIRLAALLILIMSLVSCVANIYVPLAFVSDACLVLGIIMAIYTLKAQQTRLIHILIALALLLSTLIWSALITDANLRIGIFHLCLGLYFALASRALYVAPLLATKPLHPD